MAENIVVLTDVHKRFPKTGTYREIFTFWRRKYVTALNGVSLSVPRGGTFGILGVNGAGKTTLLKILAGLILINKGRVVVEGVDVSNDPERVKDYLLYVSGDERTHYMRLSGRHNLEFYAVLSEVPAKKVKKRVEEVLDIVGLTESADEQSIKYSTGMKQRLSFARGLLADPGIFLLDEPTRSIDPLGARQIWEFVKHELIEKQKKSVLIATHNMEEAAYLCDRVAVIDRGVVKANSSVEALIDSMASRDVYMITVEGPSEGYLENLSAMPSIRGLRHKGLEGARPGLALEVTLKEGNTDVAQIVQAIVQSGGSVTGVSQQRPTLGDVVAGMARAGAR